MKSLILQRKIAAHQYKERGKKTEVMHQQFQHLCIFKVGQKVVKYWRIKFDISDCKAHCK